MNQDNNPNEPLNQNRANPRLLHQHDNPPRFQKIKKVLPSLLVIVGFIIMSNMFQELRAQKIVLQAELEELKNTQMASQRQISEDSRSISRNYLIELEELKKNITVAINNRDQTQKQTEEALRRESHDLKVELDEVKKSLTTHMQNSETFKKDLIASVTNEKIQMQQQLDRYKSENQDLKIELQEFKKGLETQITRETLAAVRSENEKLQKEVAFLRESTRKYEEIHTEQDQKLREFERNVMSEMMRFSHQESGKVNPSQNSTDASEYAQKRIPPVVIHAAMFPSGEFMFGPPPIVRQNCIRNIIKFEKPFSSQPKVVVSISKFSGGDFENADVNAENITIYGFELVCCGWKGNPVNRYFANWFAYESS